MDLAPDPSDASRTVAERRRAGRALRQRTPRRAHAGWAIPAGRPDPIKTLIETGRNRVQRLVPLRHSRMKANAFAFMRGAAAIMAGDLATGPSSGLLVQACGDCHLGNFGAYASPEGSPVFDINDFDETLAAPFEWDLKRLAASFVVAARDRRLSHRRATALAGATCRAYRERIAELARMDPLAAWRARIDLADALSVIPDPKRRRRAIGRLQALSDSHRAGYPKLIERRDGAWRIRIDPAYTHALGDRSDPTLELAARGAFRSYRRSLGGAERLLMDRYRLTDCAFKVVGVGSVGLFCAIGLFTTADGDTLLLQLKEAQPSVLAPFTGGGPPGNQGKRVVAGQRIMQAIGDPFLGWTDHDRDDRPCYVRQLKDPRLALIGETVVDGALDGHAVLCGRALARAHARSQDAARLWGYMGDSGAFDAAIGEFAVAYADQTERDYRLFLEAIDTGLIDAGPICASPA